MQSVLCHASIAGKTLLLCSQYYATPALLVKPSYYAKCIMTNTRFTGVGVATLLQSKRKTFNFGNFKLQSLTHTHQVC